MDHDYIAYMKSRPELITSIRRHVEDGVKPGSFLSAVLDNDLREAIGQADDENLIHIWHVVAYCYHEIPGTCWGSKSQAQAWRAGIQAKAKASK